MEPEGTAIAYQQNRPKCPLTDLPYRCYCSHSDDGKQMKGAAPPSQDHWMASERCCSEQLLGNSYANRHQRPRALALRTWRASRAWLRRQPFRNDIGIIGERHLVRFDLQPGKDPGS